MVCKIGHTVHAVLTISKWFATTGLPSLYKCLYLYLPAQCGVRLQNMAGCIHRIWYLLCRLAMAVLIGLLVGTNCIFLGEIDETLNFDCI